MQITPATLQLTVDGLRMFLRDTVDENILLDEIEHPTKNIEQAMRLTVAKWNAITPMSNLTDPAQMNEYLLLCGVCGLLLKSEGIRQARNAMHTRDGNIDNVSLDENESTYLKWAAHFQQEFDSKAKPMKIQQNLESILDCSSGFGSGYRWLGKYAT
jgi:hypothetical protein